MTSVGPVWALSQIPNPHKCECLQAQVCMYSSLCQMYVWWRWHMSHYIRCVYVQAVSWMISFAITISANINTQFVWSFCQECKLGSSPYPPHSCSLSSHELWDWDEGGRCTHHPGEQELVLWLLLCRLWFSIRLPWQMAENHLQDFNEVDLSLPWVWQCFVEVVCKAWRVLGSQAKGRPME